MSSQSESVAIIIPSRYGSTRLMGKPLESISGQSMIHRVWSIANAVAGVEFVFVATDDMRIADHVRGFGGAVVMTPSTCENGTERVLAATGMLRSPPSIVVNLQGDAVLTPPWVIEALVHEMRRDTSVGMATIAVRMDQQQYALLVEAKSLGEVGGTTVVFDRARNALYFSKSPIPFVRRDDGVSPPEEFPVFRHVGLYGYRLETLHRLSTLSPGPLERAEKLEQLRALEHGIPIRIVEVDYRGRTHWAVDSREDLVRVEEIIKREGELVKL